jgi:hypothetical protein
VLSSGACMNGPATRVARAVAGIVMLGALAAGCTANGPAPTLISAAPRGTVAFESIDGLPEGQFRKLVQSLSQEAEWRQLAVVSRAENAQYRVRGYAAASIRGKRTTISWVWDVYDADRQRTTRIYGEERSSTAHRGWAVADDAMIDRIAKDGMTQLAGFLGSPGGNPPPATVPAAPTSGPAVAAADPGPAPALAMQPRATAGTHAALTTAQR